ncbi:hypothetical protein KC19_VG209800 [Ceratodon purpureus]|uniref:Uncharacterized protein n=1 Tax=Ceratodon purpureus TaxID=3225 RepID=A0A8T0HSL4_CERPU|nr:hypothetical protein KC19_VG209800 [Ceratodon purpureus]
MFPRSRAVSIFDGHWLPKGFKVVNANVFLTFRQNVLSKRDFRDALSRGGATLVLCNRGTSAEPDQPGEERETQMI